IFPVLMPVPKNPVVDPVSASVKMERPPTKKLPCSLRISESAIVATAAARSRASIAAGATNDRTDLANRGGLFTGSLPLLNLQLAERYHALSFRAKPRRATRGLFSGKHDFSGTIRINVACWGGRWNKFRIAEYPRVLGRTNFRIDFQFRIGLTSY